MNENYKMCLNEECTLLSLGSRDDFESYFSRFPWI
jgi:hypothetical protein